MTEYEKQVRQKLKDNFEHYASRCLLIRTKSGEIKPFLLNKAQKYVHEIVEDQIKRTGKVRALVLKGRQQGMSTYISGRFYHKSTHRFGVRVFILTHEEDATNNLFEMAKRYHEHCPVLVKPTTKTSNAKELIFDGLDSGYKLGTAGNKSVGRSSTIQYLHGSEVAYWPNAAEHAKGILQTVPDERGTEIFLESTANGVGNYFHQQWQDAEAGLSDFIAIFVPWFWEDRYQREVSDDFIVTPEEQKLIDLYGLTKEQLAWRRSKIVELSVNGMNGEKAFMQEYPCNAAEAFQNTGEDTYFDTASVMALRKTEAEAQGPLLVGVDPARFGDDRSSIIRRRTRKAYGLESHVKKDLMELVGIVHKIIIEENPLYVFVDVGGLGAGVVDRLIELGHKKIIVPVNAGSKPLNEKKYSNKRAEMWGECKEWTMDYPCQIPDSDSLHADLCNIKYKFDSNSRLVMESKQEMKKRGVRSPDEAEALILTFAYPISALHKQNDKSEEIASTIMSKFNTVQAIRRNRS